MKNFPPNINTINVFSSPARCPISVGHGEGSEERARPGPASMSKTEWGKKCMSIHKNISAQHEAWVFAKPVDTVALGLHDYHSIITRPMDLETVKTSMDSGTITTPDQFIADMQLIFQVPLCPAPRQREACQRRGPVPATNNKPGCGDSRVGSKRRGLSHPCARYRGSFVDLLLRVCTTLMPTVVCRTRCGTTLRAQMCTSWPRNCSS